MIVGPSVAGILLTGFIYGRAGFREFGSRLLKWRAGARWYAVAFLTAPLSVTAALLALSLTSPEFLPGIFTSDDKAALVPIRIFAGLMVGIFEELGWTGFAILRMRLRHGVLSTGLMVGLERTYVRKEAEHLAQVRPAKEVLGQGYTELLRTP